MIEKSDLLDRSTKEATLKEVDVGIEVGIQTISNMHMLVYVFLYLLFPLRTRYI